MNKKKLKSMKYYNNFKIEVLKQQKIYLIEKLKISKVKNFKLKILKILYHLKIKLFL